MCSVSQPPPRDYAQETRDTMQAQLDLAPQRFEAERQYQPLYTDLTVDNIRRAVLGGEDQPGLMALYDEVAPRMQEAASAAQQAQRERDVADIARLGPEAVAAIRSADPMQQALVERLNQEAVAGLDAGVGLDPALADQVSQNVRAAQASRGFGFGNPDAIAEAFALGERGVAMRDQSRRFATGVAGLNAATAADPAMAVLGRPSGAVGATAGLLGQAQGVGPGQVFNPESAYASDVFNTNFNADAAARIAEGQGKASIIGGALSY